MTTTRKTATKKTTTTIDNGDNGKPAAKAGNKEAPAPGRSSAKSEAVATAAREAPVQAVPQKAAPRGATNIMAVVTEDDRRRMIAERAYFIAEKRGFAGGDPTHDWLVAEAEVSRGLRARATA